MRSASPYEGDHVGMTYLLGVDGGNSKTAAMVADHTGRILGVGRAGGGNHQGQGLEPAMVQIRGAIDQALDAANLQQVETGFYALAGADLENDYAILRPAVAQLPYSRRAFLDNDVAAALRSGTSKSDAV